MKLDMKITDDLSAYVMIKVGLLEQGCKATTEHGDCRYRGGSWEQNGPDRGDVEFVLNGTKCAVGVIIDDEHYHAALENNVIYGADNSVQNAVRCSNPDWDMTSASVDFLAGMQYIHDNIEVEDWQMIFDIIDERFDSNSTFPGADTLPMIYSRAKKEEVSNA